MLVKLYVVEKSSQSNLLKSIHSWRKNALIKNLHRQINNQLRFIRTRINFTTKVTKQRYPKVKARICNSILPTPSSSPKRNDIIKHGQSREIYFHALSASGIHICLYIDLSRSYLIHLPHFSPHRLLTSEPRNVAQGLSPVTLLYPMKPRAAPSGQISSITS